MALEIITKNDKEIPYGTLCIDGHSILDSVFYSDFDWLQSFELGIREHFPQFCNLTVSEVLDHPDLPVFKAYLQHQIRWKHSSIADSAFHDKYDPWQA